MCGITGVITSVPAPMGRTIQAMNEALSHRGPDGWGFVALNPGAPCDAPPAQSPSTAPARVFLGHRRLSIIDLEGSRQPLRNENGSVWVVFNGEIYNYRELATELAAKGHLLREKGDTETLVHLWEEYGEDMVEKLNGMFAFALYDVARDVLLLARDRYGEKPLFYWDDPRVFAFASELQALWEVEGFPLGRADPEAAAQYFRYGYTPSPATIYPGVRCLPPGSLLVRRNGRASVKTYWKPSVRGETAALDIGELGERLDAAVASRLISDVPLGCFLSGGLDSSLLAASMARRGGKLLTFTISTGDPATDESAVARRIAQSLGADHQERRVTPDFAAVSEKLARHYGQPFADFSSVPTYHVSLETRKKVKVAISGDGGDELFAGYDRYANLGLASFLGRLPRGFGTLAGALAQRALPASDFRSRLADFLRCAGKNPIKGENPSPLFNRYWATSCFTEDFLRFAARQETDRFTAYYREAASTRPLDRWLEVDQRMYLPDDILTKVDIASMAASLETRAPFLDHRFAEYANRLAPELKLAHRRSKLPLRALAAKRLPEGVDRLPKRGFTLPMASWLREGLKDWAEAHIFESPAPWREFLREKAIRKLWEEHQRGQADHAARLWIVLAFALWRRTEKRP